jgi:ABC-type branched-subunit amino acid transport system permease subunit
MNETVHTGRTDRSRLSYIGLWALATLAFVGLSVAGYPAVGAVAFFGLGGATVALGDPESMFDERDADIIEEASANTIRVVGLSAAVVFPTVSALAGLGYIAFPLWLAPIGAFVAAMFALWGGFLLLARRRR